MVACGTRNSRSRPVAAAYISASPVSTNSTCRRAISVPSRIRLSGSHHTRWRLAPPCEILIESGRTDNIDRQTPAARVSIPPTEGGNLRVTKTGWRDTRTVYVAAVDLRVQDATRTARDQVADRSDLAFGFRNHDLDQDQHDPRRLGRINRESQSQRYIATPAPLGSQDRKGSR